MVNWFTHPLNTAKVKRAAAEANAAVKARHRAEAALRTAKKNEAKYNRRLNQALKRNNGVNNAFYERLMRLPH